MYALTEPISELLGVPIPERGVNAMLRCPLHEDRSPSFSIHLDEGVWHCFGCEESGTLNGLYRRLGEEVSRDVRLHQAKEKAKAPEVFSRDFTKKASSLHHALRREDSRGRGRRLVEDTFESRGIRQAAVGHYGLGYDSTIDAISFPYIDTERRVTGIKYRHRNGFKTSEVGSRYGLFDINNIIGKGRVIICEGESDTLAVWSKYGDSYGVGGTSGASVSDSQWSTFSLSLLYAERVYLLYDADEAGDRASDNAMRMLGDDKCVRVRPPDGSDASDWLSAGHTLEEIGLE